MTKKDYEHIAYRIKLVREAKGVGSSTIDVVVLALCKEFELHNPRFSVEKFMAACGSELLQPTEILKLAGY